MHYERSLKRSIYEPWSEQYIDYHKLKNLLRDDGSDAGSVHGDDGDDWTEKDEGAFVEELINVQLEKVHNFQSNTVQTLREQTSSCEKQLEGLTSNFKEKEGNAAPAAEQLDSEAKGILENVLKDLDGITKEMNELEKYSRINYTGFLKAAKKHDRRRGDSYRVMPIMRVRLGELPFNKEDYSPLLFRLSTMYTFCRQRLNTVEKPRAYSEYSNNVDTFTSHKFWVHPEHLLELKTVILRRLPVLIYNPQASKVAEGGQKDPTITSIYLDNPQFSLYNAKVSHQWPATSLRLRWYDSLLTNPEVYCEKKTVNEDDTSKESKFTTKAKYIQGFLHGENKMEREIQRLTDRVGADSDQVTELQDTIDEISSFIHDNKLQPVVRANYTRTAFQIPGDGRVRITLDTNLALIREDSLDSGRPCRDPDEWHRKDVDDTGIEYPFERIRKGEINRFPYAILEIRIRGSKNFEWVNELMNSHLVKSAPRFSKFTQGVASLFDDHVNAFPFWLSEVETDIRRDPLQAFEEEQQRKAKAAEDEVAVGSLLGSTVKSAATFRPDVQSPVGSPSSSGIKTRPGKGKRVSVQSTRVANDDDTSKRASKVSFGPSISEEPISIEARDSKGIRSYLPSLSMSKYAQAKRQRVQAPGELVALPPGVHAPTHWIKDEGPVKVEAKVWLANQRTFIKWQHIAILLASLSLGLFNAAGKENNVARALGVVYTAMALFIALWGWAIYMYRARLIEQRSGKDFDNVLGPIVVCVGLVVALCLNFGFKVGLERYPNADLLVQEPYSSEARRSFVAQRQRGCTWHFLEA